MIESRLTSRVALLVIQVLDMLCLVAMLVYVQEADALGQFFGIIDFSKIQFSVKHTVLLLFYAFTWRYILLLTGNYEFRFLDGYQKVLTKSVIGCTLGVGAAVILVLLFGIQINWSLFPFKLWSLSLGFLLTTRFGTFVLLYFIRSKGRNLRKIVVVGLNDRSLNLFHRLKETGLGLDFLGFFDDIQQLQRRAVNVNDLPFLGTLQSFGSYISVHPVDMVLLALPIRSYYDDISRIINTCATQGIQTMLLTDLFLLPPHTAFRIHKTHDETFVNYYTDPRSDLQYELKRLIDVLLSAAAILVLSPVFLIISLLIYLDDRGPIFFVQERIGLNKRRFKMIKFRTMIKGADQIQDKLEEMNEAQGAVFKITKDPRITRFGHFLRRTSLDEIPQFFNVLFGSMSLVGPRPLPVRDFERFYDDSHRLRFSVKPGITGMWQVSGRSNMEFEEWMKLDSFYVHHWSLLLDILILFRTPKAVFTAKGAY